jgi:hypothetical protein
MPVINARFNLDSLSMQPNNLVVFDDMSSERAPRPYPGHIIVENRALAEHSRRQIELEPDRG